MGRPGEEIYLGNLRGYFIEAVPGIKREDVQKYPRHDGPLEDVREVGGGVDPEARAVLRDGGDLEVVALHEA